jgi:capsular exopolysaccharide synthesis family protein
MSRIDEALRRMAEDRGEEPPNRAQVEESERTSEQWSVQQYPSEHVAAPKRVERPARSVERPAIAHVPVAPVAGPVPVSADRLAALVEGDARLVVSRHAPQLLVEQLRRLAAILDEAQTARRLKTVAITSAVPREGKTLTAANLALTLSESFSRRVLLMDADLRRPALHAVLGVTNGSGLSDALRGVRSRDHRPTQITSRLSFLGAGPAERNPLSALSSDRMRELLHEYEAQFDWIVIDTPPVGVLPDAQVVARLAGGVLFVIAAGTTPYHVIERAISEVGRDCIVGTVLNRVDDRGIPETSYYGDYYDAPTGRDSAG